MKAMRDQEERMMVSAWNNLVSCFRFQDNRTTALLVPGNVLSFPALRHELWELVQL